MDDVTKTNLLFDFYGDLLSKRQKQVASLYYEENLSLSEIGEVFEISRQGAHDALKNAQKALADYEEKLGLLKRLKRQQAQMEDMEKLLKDLLATHSTQWERKKLQEVYRILLTMKE